MALRLTRNPKETAPESVAEVDARIRANDAEAIKLTQQRAAIEDELILMDESDPTLLDQISRIDVQTKVTAGRRQRLQAERTQAQIQEGVTAHAQRVEGIRALHTRLMALENSAETKATVARYQAISQEATRLRTDLREQLSALHTPLLPNRIDLSQLGHTELLTTASTKIAALDGTIRAILDTVWDQFPIWLRPRATQDEVARFAHAAQINRATDNEGAE